MAKIYLISINTLKDNYIVDDNIDDKYILPNITKCQDFIIKPILGEDKYNEIINQIDTDTVTSDNNILIKDYIQPVIAYYVLSETVYSTAYKIKNNPDYQNNQNTDRFDELVRISKKYLNDSQHYEQILRDYICDNSISIVPEVVNPYKTGLFITPKYKHCNCK